MTRKTQTLGHQTDTQVPIQNVTAKEMMYNIDVPQRDTNHNQPTGGQYGYNQDPHL